MQPHAAPAGLGCNRDNVDLQFNYHGPGRGVPDAYQNSLLSEQLMVRDHKRGTIYGLSIGPPAGERCPPPPRSNTCMTSSRSRPHPRRKRKREAGGRTAQSSRATSTRSCRTTDATRRDQVPDDSRFRERAHGSGLRGRRRPGRRARSRTGARTGTVSPTGGRIPEAGGRAEVRVLVSDPSPRRPMVDVSQCPSAEGRGGRRPDRETS